VTSWERTFAKARCKDHRSADGAVLMLTVAKYEDPNGKKIEDNAVTPNVSSPRLRMMASRCPFKRRRPLNQALSLLKAKNG